MKATNIAITFLALLVVLEPFAFYNFGISTVYLITILILCSVFFLYIEIKKTGAPKTSSDGLSKPKEEQKKVEFVSLAVHQLRAPLSTIKMSLEMFIGDEFGKISDEQKDILKKIYKKNDTMISLVDSLLNVAMLEDTKNVYGKSTVYIEDLIQSVINSCQEELKGKAIELEFKKPEERLPGMILDEKKMKLVFQNLFDNAIKYTPAGGKIKASVSLKGREIEFVIHDSGIGIPENQKDQMFTKFFRGRNAARTGVDGSGLGLFITKSIIDAHRGKIWFESKENEGTTFYVTLPLE